MLVITSFFYVVSALDACILFGILGVNDMNSARIVQLIETTTVHEKKVVIQLWTVDGQLVQSFDKEIPKDSVGETLEKIDEMMK